jgi:peptidoglycan/xylan/chitin deacetylase (PgdA/CDA1 family)
VSITFDNLGEAAQLELGMWPAEVPEGEHFTVVEVLPRLLDLLATRGVEATFFVEGLNAEMYPEALLTIVAAGHEVAVHAWRHEEWAALGGEREVALLRRATDAMRAIGIEPRGFRPPGGGLTARTLELLAEHGYSYVSPAGEREGLLDGLAVLPFRWPLVDAYSYLPQFATLREGYGAGPDPVTPEEMRAEMIAALRGHSQQEGHLTLLFHPFSVAFTGDPGWEALDEVLGETVRLAARSTRPEAPQIDAQQVDAPQRAVPQDPDPEAGAITALRMDEAAARMLARPADTRPPLLDDATWMTR